MTLGTRNEIQYSTENQFIKIWTNQLEAATYRAGLSHSSVAKWLDINKSSYNKRRRGEISFTAWEFVRLCERFGLPTTPSETGGETVRFFLPKSGTQPLKGGTGYLSSLRTLVDTIDLQLRERGENASVVVSTTDIPIPYLLDKPTLCAIKLYLFSKDDPSFTWPSLNINSTDSVDLFNGNLVAKRFQECNSVQIWGEKPFRSFIQQLHFLLKMHVLTAEIVRLAYEELRIVVDELDHLLNQAQTSRSVGSLKVYRDRKIVLSPSYVLKTNLSRYTLLTYDAPRFLIGRSAAAADLVCAGFQRRLSAAEDVSAAGKPATRRYIARMREAIDKGEREAIRLLEVLDEL